MHLLVKNTKISIVFCWLPTFFVFAAVYFALSFFVLSEVEAFCWKHFTANWELKIFVWNQAIHIHIKLIEYMLKLKLCNVHTPEIEEEF